MKKGDIILIKCSHKKIIPILIIGKMADNIIGLQVQGYNKTSNIKNKVSKKYRNDMKKLLEEKKKRLEKITVVIGKPDGLRYESIIKVNREIIIECKNIVAIISKINDKLYAEVLDKYKSYKRNQALHRELHKLKQKIFLCQMNNEKYYDYEKRLSEILIELDFPEINKKHNKGSYSTFREIPTDGYIKVYRGGR